MTRAKTATMETVQNYFDELQSIINKYHLEESPQLIFNIDETGISPEHNPPMVIGPKGVTIPAVTSPRSGTTTLISCVSATGQVMPPFIIF